MPSMHTYRMYTWFFLVLGWLCNVDIQGRIHLISEHIREQWCMAIWISLFGAGRLKTLVNLLNMLEYASNPWNQGPIPCHAQTKEVSNFKDAHWFCEFHWFSLFICEFRGKGEEGKKHNPRLGWKSKNRWLRSPWHLLCYIEMKIPKIPRKIWDSWHFPPWTMALICPYQWPMWWLTGSPP